jgi:cold shock CspA family protein
VVFSQHDVLDADFNRLEEGRLVQFTEVQSDRGPQAVTVRPIEELNFPGKGQVKIV